MSEVIHVYLIQRRYSSAVPMNPTTVRTFIEAMEDYAANVLAVDPPKIDAPQNGESIRFTFEVGDE